MTRQGDGWWTGRRRRPPGAGASASRGPRRHLYAEITREGRDRKLVLVDENVDVGRAYRVAVREDASKPGWWQVWVDGEDVTKRIRMPGSSGRWAPIVTAESWNGGTPTCNAFGFRFEHVAVSRGGAWRPFVSGHRFLDGTHTLRDLSGAFVASSGSA